MDAVDADPLCRPTKEHLDRAAPAKTGEPGGRTNSVHHSGRLFATVRQGAPDGVPADGAATLRLLTFVPDKPVPAATLGSPGSGRIPEGGEYAKAEEG